MTERKSVPLSDEELIAILRKEEQAASNYQDSALAAEREKALNYYDRQPYGDEQDGASSVVTSEFADVIESVMPGMMRVFTGTDAVVTFAPGAPGEEQAARDATQYVQHVMMRQNDGFRIVYWLIKDALMYRLSAATVDIEDYEEKKRVPVSRITRDAIDQMLAESADEGVDVELELEEDAGPIDLVPETLPGPDADPNVVPMIPQPTFSGEATFTHKRQRVVVDNIAPEDILFTPTARDQDKASFLGFRKRVTGSELVAMGLSQDDVDMLRSDRAQSIEENQRSDGSIQAPSSRDTVGDSERPLWVVVAYVRADVNGDGISEMLRVVYAHAGGMVASIIDQQEWEGMASIALASPILMSHSIIGRSLFDQTQDLQRVSSVLTRGMLDNLYLVNRPRPTVSDQVNIDSLIDWVPGSPVRLKAGAKPGDRHVDWLQVPNITGGVLAALEYQKTVGENRTGVVRNNQGLDADSLNKTAKGMGMLMSAAQSRQELIARVLAETAIKRIAQLVYRAIKKSCTGPVSYWAGKTFVDCDPRLWPDAMELSADIGLGTGNKEQVLQHLTLIGGIQEKLIALQGGKADGPFVTKENVATLSETVAEALGFKSPGRFFQPPERVAQAVPAQDGPPPKPPELLVAEAQIKILQEAAAADVLIKRTKAENDVAIANFKARQWAEIERYKAGLKGELDMRELEHKTALKGVEIAADAHAAQRGPIQ